jgi:hypothetical protein
MARMRLARLMVIVFLLQSIAGCDRDRPKSGIQCDIFKSEVAHPIAGIMVEPIYGARYFMPDLGDLCRVDLSSVKPEKFREIPKNSDCFAIISRSTITGYSRGERNIVTKILSSKSPSLSDNVAVQRLLQERITGKITLCTSSGLIAR